MRDRITFYRAASGDVDLSSLDEIKVRLRDPETARFTVSRAIRTAAEERLVSMARELAFTSHRPFFAAAEEIVRRHPELYRLSRAPVDLDNYAVVTVKELR